MEVSIPAKYEKMVLEIVDAGRYSSTAELIGDALRLLEEQEAVRQFRLDSLRADVQAAMDQIDRGETVDGDEFVSALRQKYGWDDDPS